MHGYHVDLGVVEDVLRSRLGDLLAFVSCHPREAWEELRALGPAGIPLATWGRRSSNWSGWDSERWGW